MKNWQEMDGGWSVAWLHEAPSSIQIPAQVPSVARPVTFPVAWSNPDRTPTSCQLWATLRIDRAAAGKNLCLRVPAANGVVRVFVDGSPAGPDAPPWLNSLVDLTPFAREEGTIALCLLVQGPSADAPSGEGESLLTGPILTEEPKFSISSGAILEHLQVYPDLQAERVRFSWKFRNPARCKVQLGLRLTSPDNQKGDTKREVELATADATYEVELEIPDPTAWHPEHPSLYVLETTIDGGQPIRTPFGFTTPSWSDKGISLNDAPLFVRGVRWDAAGRSGFLANANPKAEFARMREAGFNTVFPCSAPFPEPLIVMAMQAGLLVIQNLGIGSLADGGSTFEAAVAHSVRLVARQDHYANVLGFVGADLPGSLLEARAADWLKAVQTERTERLPKGLRRDASRTLAAHCAGTRLEIGAVPTQDSVAAVFAGTKAPGAIEIHRFRLSAPVSLARQQFLSHHLHPREPGELSDQGLGDTLFWKKLQKAKTKAGHFLAARLGCPSLLNPETALQALGEEQGERVENLRRLSAQFEEELRRRHLLALWKSPSAFISGCHQVGAHAILRQAESLTINPRCAGFLVHQWSDTALHSSGLVSPGGQTKPGWDLFRKFNRHTRVIAEAAIRTPYMMQSAAVRIHMANESVPGEYALLLRVKGNNGRIWHQESLPAHAELGSNLVGKFEFPVGDEPGSFTFDMQLSRHNREIFRTEETFYVPPSASIESAAPVFRYLGEFPEVLLANGRDDAASVLINQVATFDPKRLKDLLDEAVAGLTLVFAPLGPDDARFLARNGELPFPVEIHPAAAAGGEGYHFIGQSPLFAKLPAGQIAGEIYADLLPSWTLAPIEEGQLVAGFAQLEGAADRWAFRGDIQIVPYGKGRLVFYQYRIFDKVGQVALADSLFSNLAEFLRG